MDSIDRGVILDLQRNCRITLRELAERQGVTSNAIRKRIASLEQKGVIREYVVELSRAMVNSELMFALVYTDKTVDDDVFAERVFAHPFVVRVHYDSYGTCVVLAEYSGTEQMNELSTYLRRLDSVED
ncbi:MAG: winged helix-turn-helix transcriptional regulator, partial [Candidatus Thorarchaeota archaeon]|nr:winged helix-turn-helix transcriptional regulator [Candidatus Thorarchaeota archaeon]